MQAWGSACGCGQGKDLRSTGANREFIPIPGREIRGHHSTVFPTSLLAVEFNEGSNPGTVRCRGVMAPKARSRGSVATWGAVSMAIQPVVIQVRVRPGSRSSTLEQGDDGMWLAHVKAAPVDGKANEELIALVASRFGCRKSAVSIRSGASGRMKLVRIDAP